MALSSADKTSFLYGTCTPAPDAGCAPPAQVTFQELCSFAPFDFTPSGNPEHLRGTATFLPVREGQALVRTGTVAITLFGQDDAMTRRMAASLEPLNLDPPIAAGNAMPPPASCTGEWSDDRRPRFRRRCVPEGSPGALQTCHGEKDRCVGVLGAQAQTKRKPVALSMASKSCWG